MNNYTYSPTAQKSHIHANNKKYLAEEIKSRLTMDDLIRVYFPHLKPRNGRIPCPIHNGDNPNFAYRGITYNCFSCGAKGDIINFVKEVFALSFPAALDKLNSDFGLGLVTDRRMTMRERREAEQKYCAKIEERVMRQQHRQDIFDVWLWYKKMIDDFKNCVPLDEITEEEAQLYAGVVTTFDYLEYLLNCCSGN